LIATVKDEGGKVVALHGLMMDAHTIVLTEQTVRQEQKRLRRFVDAMPAMIWRADTGGQIDQWSRTMQLGSHGRSQKASICYQRLIPIKLRRSKRNGGDRLD
jgi:hypothetical protein